MTSRWLSWGLGLACVLGVGKAHATVEAILDYTIVYEEPQSGDFCYRSLPMRAEIGIPPASVMRAVFSPVRIFNENGLPSQYININAVGEAPLMVANYESDVFEADGTLVYRMNVDVTELSRRNGTTRAGRLETIKRAKLGLLAMSKSLEALMGGKYKLFLTFRGLPAQGDLGGTPLYATTSFPYTGGSPLLRAYQAEYINAGGSCR